MWISWNWLNRHVDLSGLDPREAGRSFTLHVAEVETVVEVGAGLDAMRTVRVESVAPIEGSDKLTRVTVADGERRETVVCGAPNAVAALGRVAVLAPAGAAFPDGTVVRSATIRGVRSDGVLASERELGLSLDHSGIMLLGPDTEPGRSLPDAAPVHDWLWEVDNKSITHRPDLWGHFGVAREVALLLGRQLRIPDPRVDFGVEPRVTAEVLAPDLCPRYVCALFDRVRVGPSPEWLRCLLRATGVRPISNVVDLTNFVMMDVGEPMHAFDARFVAGHRIIVRRAMGGEVARTLDGQDRVCDEDTLLICDAEKPVAIAGVMGGEGSEIRDDTSEVILEAANFHAGNIRRTSMRLGLRTESSARFEKALDPAVAELAARSFARLMLDLVPGCRVKSPMVDVCAPLPAATVIPLRAAAVSQRLGIEVPAERTARVLEGLGFGVSRRSGDDLLVRVPTWRATRDVSIPEDLIEEVGRIHGYQNIPPEPPRVLVQTPRLSKAKTQERSARHFLTSGCGLYETLSYGFVWKPILQRLGADLSGRLELANTISSDMDLMRRYLVPNLLLFAERNGRYHRSYGLYEIGRVFEPRPGTLPDQPRHLGIVIVHDPAEIAPEKGETAAERQFRVLRGVVEGLLEAIGAPAPSLRRELASDAGKQEAARPWVHPARSLAILCGGADVGYLTLAHPKARQVLDVPGALSIVELDLDRILGAGEAVNRYAPLPRYPAVGFDVSFEVAEEVTAEALAEAIREGAGTELLRSCSLFANYHLDAGRKSVSFRLEFRSDERSLTDTEVHERTAAMIAYAGAKLGASLRGG